MVSAKSHDIAELNAAMTGSGVTLAGWIEDLREMGRMTFATLRDASGLCQIITRGEVAAKMAGMTRQSVVQVSGVIQETRARDFDFEVAADDVALLAGAVHPLPIDPIGRLRSNIDARLNHRALDMRDQKTAAIFKIRHRVLQATRDHLARQFTEITTPKIIGSASEGGANLFSLEYFGQTAYLAQSPQLYKEQMTMGLERVFEVSSFYRAENSHTGRHLTEFTSIDVEAAFMDYTDVMETLESLVVRICTDVAQECAEELKTIGRTPITPSPPFEVVTYPEALEDLQEEGIHLKFGEDLQDAHLRVLGRRHPAFFFLTDWPLNLKPFYIMEKEKGLSRSFDLQYGYLELSSGGTRLHDPAVLESRLVEQNLNPRQFAEHLKVFGWGMPPHSGWGMGLDRLLAVLTGHDNVREVVLYPRDPDRLLP